MAAAAASKDKVYTLEEVARHDKEGDLWIVVNGAVWDLSRFADMHPGGSGTLLQRDIAGKDATEAFFSLHRSEVSIVHCILTRSVRLLIVYTATGFAQICALPNRTRRKSESTDLHIARSRCAV